MKSNSLFDSLVKDIKKSNDFAFMLDEENPYEVKEWIDTGCYMLNAILSDGDIFKGLPKGKRIMLSGGEATFKSLLGTLLIKSYIDNQPNASIIFFETEGSSTVKMALNAEIPSDKMIIIPVSTVEETRTQMVNILDKINDAKYGYETKKSEKTGEIKKVKIKDFEPIPLDKQENFIIVLDSLGMLSTKKETEDVSAGKDTRDMTRSQLIKSFARIISLKLSMAQIPLIIINHVYSTMDQYAPQAVGGGSGTKYMSDVSLIATKAKQKEGTEQIGIILGLKIDKSRFMQENKLIKLPIHFKKGLYKYAYLIDFAQENNLFEREGISFILPDGTKAKMKDVRDNPSKYLNDINLDFLRKKIMDIFGFGSNCFEMDQEEVKINETMELVEE